MSDLLILAFQNVAVALVLAVFVHGLTRLWHNPPLAHVLWAIVLLKLVAPPVLPVERSVLGLVRSAPNAKQRTAGILPSHGPNEPRVSRIAQSPRAEALTVDARAVDYVAEPATASALIKTEPKTQGSAGGNQTFTIKALPLLFCAWLAGAAICAIAAVTRIVRFERLLRDALPPAERWQRLLAEVAGKLGVRRLPEIRCVESVEVALLWCIRRPTIVLPARLLRELDDREIALILAHELAHLRRRDHWVRAAELFVSIVHWWNPLAWAVRRQIHQAEDLCCDAWVRSAFADCRKRYAEVLLKAAEFACGSPLPSGWAPASSFIRTLSLKARIEMILESQFKPRVSARSLVAAMLLALLLLPSFFLVARRDALADTKGEVAEEKSETRSEFPHVVKFEKGASKFLAGDEIAIVEVRGTADSFTPGGIYLVKGKYTLTSHDRASLAAYTTAKNAADGRSRSFTAQHTIVEKGSGAFTLFLPMGCEGWPHVSYYPADGGEGFGGVYFGTGDSVLKRWWGENEADASAKDDKSARTDKQKTRLRRGPAKENGEFVISFENPAGFELERGKHQVIFQVFVGISHKPIRQKIFRQLEIEDDRYEVPVKIAPELMDDSRVSITFVTIQPEHDAWVKAFFDEGKKTSYRGLWTSDGDLLPAIPLAAENRTER